MLALSWPAGACARRRGRPGRSPLLLAAALVLTVPGMLVSACSGQPADPTQASRAAAGPAVPPADRAPAAARRPGSAQAVTLLAQAAQAAVVTSYQGEEVVTRWGDGGTSVLVSDIWHVSGGPTITRTLDPRARVSRQPYLSSDRDGQAPEGVLGVTMPLVRLLERHYAVAYAGTGSAGQRTAQVVEVRRADGSLAARFWLDDATKLPLEREVFDADAHVIGRDVFIDVRFAGPGSTPAAKAHGSWSGPLPPAQLLGLRARGWLVPSHLPGGLLLFTGAEASAGAGPVVDLGYSDGLSVVSVFEQHGNLAASLAGWRKTTVSGRPVFVSEPDQRSLTWSSHGMVYTVLADAPAQIVAGVVGALPHAGPAGFWKRMSRGLARLASWANPFR